MPKAPPFTAQSAREAAARSAVARRARKQALAEALASPAEAVAQAIQSQPAAQPMQPDGFAAYQLASTRAHLLQLNRQFAGCRDPQKLDRLAAAIGRLSEVERNLAGRPTPGALRPTKASSRRPAAAAVMPLDE